MRRSAGLVLALPLALALAAPANASELAASVVPTKVPSSAVQRVALAKPEGFVEMFVTAVITTEGGPAVVLQDAQKRRMLPIWVGMGEAHAIQLRLENKRFPRPLTHDLFDTVLQRLGGSLVKIHVDDLKGDTFIGTIFVKRGNEVVDFDARPSDSIALALGSHAPIYVAEDLLIEMGAKAGATAKDEELDIEPEFGIENPPEGIKTL